METTKRGALIVIEGVDRSGKSTQCRQLVKTLQTRNVRAEAMSFPDRTTPVGEVIAQYLSNKAFKLSDYAIHLLFTTNRWEKAEEMRAKLAAGTTLVVDRYSYSGIAYSVAKRPGDPLEWYKAPESGLPKPDRVFLLTLGAEAMVKRKGFGEERYENVEFQSRVMDAFTLLRDSSWRTVDASGSIDAVHDILLADICDRVEEVQRKPLESLDFLHEDTGKENKLFN